MILTYRQQARLCPCSCCIKSLLHWYPGTLHICRLFVRLIHVRKDGVPGQALGQLQAMSFQGSKGLYNFLAVFLSGLTVYSVIELAMGARNVPGAESSAMATERFLSYVSSTKLIGLHGRHVVQSGREEVMRGHRLNANGASLCCCPLPLTSYQSSWKM